MGVDASCGRPAAAERGCGGGSLGNPTMAKPCRASRRRGRCCWGAAAWRRRRAHAARTTGMALIALIKVELNQMATTAPAPYKTTVVLFSTLSHCEHGKGAGWRWSGAACDRLLGRPPRPPGACPDGATHCPTPNPMGAHLLLQVLHHLVHIHGCVCLCADLEGPLASLRGAQFDPICSRMRRARPPIAGSCARLVWALESPSGPPPQFRQNAPYWAAQPLAVPQSCAGAGCGQRYGPRQTAVRSCLLGAGRVCVQGRCDTWVCWRKCVCRRQLACHQTAAAPQSCAQACARKLARARLCGRCRCRTFV